MGRGDYEAVCGMPEQTQGAGAGVAALNFTIAAQCYTGCDKMQVVKRRNRLDNQKP